MYVNAKAELVTLAPGLRPELRFAPLARGIFIIQRLLLATSISLYYHVRGLVGLVLLQNLKKSKMAEIEVGSGVEEEYFIAIFNIPTFNISILTFIYLKYSFYFLRISIFILNNYVVAIVWLFILIMACFGFPFGKWNENCTQHMQNKNNLTSILAFLGLQLKLSTFLITKSCNKIL